MDPAGIPAVQDAIGHMHGGFHMPGVGLLHALDGRPCSRVFVPSLV
jgi:hypothetical protein